MQGDINTASLMLLLYSIQLIGAYKSKRFTKMHLRRTLFEDISLNTRIPGQETPIQR